METSHSHGQSLALSHSLAQVMQRHPLFFFYLMAYAFAWPAWLVPVLAQKGRPLWPIHMTLITMIIADLAPFVGPTLSAFIMTGITEGKSGLVACGAAMCSGASASRGTCLCSSASPL